MISLSKADMLHFTQSSKSPDQHTNHSLTQAAEHPVADLQAFRGRDYFERIESTPSNLCEKCIQVDWKLLVPEIVPELLHFEELGLDDGVYNYALPSLKHWPITAEPQSSRCSVCTWVSATMRNWEYSSYIWCVKLAHQEILVGLSSKGSSPLVIVPDDDRKGTPTMVFLLHPQVVTDQFVPRCINSRSIDYALLRMWLSQCTSEHSETCLPSKSLPALKLKVLNCKTRKIVRVVGVCSYVALSYVWGPSPQQEQASETLGFPQTIEDAMVVTLMLGFEYICKLIQQAYMSDSYYIYVRLC
jgi:hypothetical protein